MDPIKIRFRKLFKNRGLADIERREITIDPRLSDERMLGTAIHEVLHLEQWDLSEEAVLRIEANIVDVLLRLGFHKTEKDGE